MRAPRQVGAAVAASAALLALTQFAPAAHADDAGSPTYTVSVDGTGAWDYPDDTPAASFIDKDGTYYFQEADALYGADDPRTWSFFRGDTMDDATPADDINHPANQNQVSLNNDTTWRCNNSPTGRESTYAPAGSGYSQRNYCDLVGVWVDPDTGDWYGLVHNEFTPQPFGDGLHFDGIDYAVSTDQGRSWTIKDHVITSPYSTKRGDTAAFPEQTYYYGDGDPRLFVDTASGYFYVFYGSRVVDKGGSWKAFYEHVARAPIADKMAPDSWSKWYDGHWSQPGVGGKESNMVPVSADNKTGYTAPEDEYDPTTAGTTSEQVAAGEAPPTSPLFVMDVSYDAHLGLYIGEPQGVDQSGNAPQEIYATDNLATQQWHKIGDTGSYHTASWYRWFLDPANRTSSTIVGKDVRAYCSYGCSNGSYGEYAKLTLDTDSPSAPVHSGSTYRIGSGDLVLSQAKHGSATTFARATHPAEATWRFVSDGDGSYSIRNGATGDLLGVDSSSTTDRAWGTTPAATPADGQPSVGQQWWVVPSTSPADGAPTGEFRLVNRYSGLVLAVAPSSKPGAETTPVRSWTDSTGSQVGGGRTVADQTLTLAPVAGSDSETSER